MPEPIKGDAYTVSTPLIDAATGDFLLLPTLATGDFQISKDGGAYANLATLPTVTPSGGPAVEIALSATEMDADLITVYAADVAGTEWDELFISIHTTVVGHDTSAEAVWDFVLEGIFSAEDMMRLIAASAAGKLSGANTTQVRIRDLSDALDRIDADVDKHGNRTAVTYDLA